MTIVTIPHSFKSIPRGEYVLLPRLEYEELTQRARAVPVVPMTAKDRRSYERSEREIKAGKFKSWNQVKNELDRFHHLKR